MKKKKVTTIIVTKYLYLFVPDTPHGGIIYSQVKKYSINNNYLFTGRTLEDKKARPELIISASDEYKVINSIKSYVVGDLEEKIVGFKDINQYLLGNRKTNQKAYFAKNVPVGAIADGNNWHRKLRAEPDKTTRHTAGAVILANPGHLSDENRVTCLNPEKPERERNYRVKDSSKPYRKFDGGYHKHCSKCPFPEGCIMCTLP